jgi:hypothetical protein
MKNKSLIAILILLLATLSGCDVNSPVSLIFNSPKCRITNYSMNFQKTGFTTLQITVVNNGDGPTAYNIGCSVRLKYGDYIVDESSAYFGYLNSNESKTEEAIFTKVKSSYDYSYMEINLYWYDADGDYYQENQ